MSDLSYLNCVIFQLYQTLVHGRLRIRLWRYFYMFVVETLFQTKVNAQSIGLCRYSCLDRFPLLSPKQAMHFYI